MMRSVSRTLQPAGIVVEQPVPDPDRTLLLPPLSGSDTPLVIDQPEDDLENRFVFDGIVPNLRKLRSRRQVILRTHNANVPVLGDAELIVTLEGDGHHGRPAPDGIGSLDDKEIRAHAENILGGT